MKRMFLIRGVPGSGKTTLAFFLLDSMAGLSKVMCSADDFMLSELDGQYQFDPSKLGECHRMCKDIVSTSASLGVDVIMVHNTFAQNWEMKPYKEIARKHGYKVCVVRCENQYGNAHGVPNEKVALMLNRFEDNVFG